ncbi:MAG TPA: trypsin-like peptidase domain-containing protein [Victivallales bacterium]|nr:trypsin-like peptidase domain-containing protein [Victivallales bacterium]
MKKYLCVFAAFFFAIFAISSQERKDAVVNAVKKVLPSVVNIGTESIVTSQYSPWGGTDPFEGFFRDFFGEQVQRRTSSLGSGVIIDASGLILTNSHVVHRASEINVVFSDGRTAKAVEIASDDLNDLALIAISPPVPSDLKPIDISCPGELYLGETVIAVGNPYGLGSSISKGILSAMNREAAYQGHVIFSDILQTDAAINPGNSGGPLINILGEMIGINTAIHREAHGIGFAIPVRRLESVVCRWLIPERFSNISLGLIPEPCEIRGNFRIAEIIPGSPAERAGLKTGMEIKLVNGRNFGNLISLGAMLWKIKPKEQVSFEDKNGKIWTVVADNLELNDGRQVAKLRLDLSLVELDEKLASSLGYPFLGGLLVSQAPKDNPEIKRGEILVRINDTRINNFEDISRALKNVRFGQKLNAYFVSLIKQGGKIYVVRNIASIEAK